MSRSNWYFIPPYATGQEWQRSWHLAPLNYIFADRLNPTRSKPELLSHRFEDKSVVFPDFDCVNQGRRSKVNSSKQQGRTMRSLISALLFITSVTSAPAPAFFPRSDGICSVLNPSQPCAPPGSHTVVEQSQLAVLRAFMC